MKALSIRQPWAWLIVNGYKDIENRSWSTNYRGVIAIHASKKIDYLAYGCIGSQFHFQVPSTESLYTGGIIGLAELTNCVTEHVSPWFIGPYGFILSNPIIIPEIKYNGMLGLFDLDDRISTIINEYLRQYLNK